MKKIGFVSIILIIGLFSLQLGLASSFRAYLTPPVANNHSLSTTMSITPVSHILETNRIIYAYPTDSIVILEPVMVCPKL